MMIKRIILSFLLGGLIASAYADSNLLSLTAMSSAPAPLVSMKQVKSPIYSPPVSLDAKALFPPSSPIEEAAFNQVTKQAMPMSPDQIRKLKQMLVVTQQAADAPAVQPPMPVTSSLLVNLSPGATPPVVRLQQGFITSLVFVDISGQKWPIEGYDLGNPNAFNIQWQQGSNTILVQATSMFTYGNLAVKLQGLTTPVMLTMVPGQRIVDYRVDLHVQGRAPDSTEPSSSGLPDHASNELLNVLNGISPQGSKELTIDGGSCDPGLNNCRAWVLGDKMYIRMPMDILSPGWIAKMQSSDGMRAYEMTKTPSILVSDYGKSVELKVEGY